jgi:hypothetical protein
MGREMMAVSYQLSAISLIASDFAGSRHCELTGSQNPLVADYRQLIADS